MSEHNDEPNDGADTDETPLASATLRALRARHAAPEPADAATDEPEPEPEPESESEPAGDDAAVEQAAEPRADRLPWLRQLSALTAGCVVAVVLALAFGVVAGVLWWQAGHSNAHDVGHARDAATVAAELSITTVNTSDYRHPQAALSNWSQVSTGSLRSQFQNARTSAIKALQQAKMVTHAQVADAAVVALDVPRGKATVIASVNVSRTPTTGSPTTIRNRFRASMSRVDGQWKLADLSIVPVGLS